MKNILHIMSSPRGAASVSIQLGNAIVEQLKAAYPGSTVKETDLVQDPFPHLDEDRIRLMGTPAAGRTEREEQEMKTSDAAVNDVLAADIIVIGAPLINFGVPSALKAWLDNIIRAGVTFSYGPNGPVGLLEGKKVYIAMASGGVYSEGPMQSYDHAAPYLMSVLSFIGLTDTTVVRAEGTKMPALADTALEKAIESIVV